MLVRKVVYPYEYTDIWERFDTILPNKNFFYGVSCLEDTTNKDYIHAQKVFKEFNIKNVGEYHDLYVQSDKLLIVDVFEDFRKKTF